MRKISIIVVLIILLISTVTIPVMAEADYPINEPDQEPITPTEEIPDTTIPLIEDIEVETPRTASADVPNNPGVIILLENNGVTVDIPVSALPEGVTSVRLVVQEALIEVGNQDSVRQTADDIANKYIAEHGGSVKINHVFELVLVDQDGNVISNFNGEIIARIPVTDDSNAVAYIDEINGIFEILPSVLKDGYIEFTTTHFSYYALIRIDDVTAVAASTLAEPKDNPPTGDNNTILLFIILANISFAIIATVIIARKQKTTVK